jgi:hypothetical protein
LQGFAKTLINRRYQLRNVTVASLGGVHLKAKTVLCAMILFSLFLAALSPLVQTANAGDSENEAKLRSFLSDVAGINLAAYDVTVIPPNSSSSSDVQIVSLNLSSRTAGGGMMAYGFFRNGYMEIIEVRGPAQGSISYLVQSSSDALEESKNVLLRYSRFIEAYGIDTAYVSRALALINNVTSTASPPEPSNFNRIGDFPNVTARSENMTMRAIGNRLSFFFEANQLEFKAKSFSLAFEINTFRFSDTWNLYEIGSVNCIPKEEAIQIGLNSAKTCKITLKDGSLATAEVKPNPTKASLAMAPQSDGTSGLKLSLQAPMILFPQWQLIFALTSEQKSRINSEQVSPQIVGVRVEIWGDTKEVASCKPDVNSPGGSAGIAIPPFPYLVFSALMAAIATPGIAFLVWNRRKRRPIVNSSA